MGFDSAFKGLTYFQASVALGRNKRIVYDVPLPYPRARRLSWHVAADADFPLDKVAMFRYVIKATSCTLCQIVLVSAVGLTLALQTYIRDETGLNSCPATIYPGKSLVAFLSPSRHIVQPTTASF